MISQLISFLFGNLDSKDIKRKEELKETALEISRNALRQYNKQKDGYVYVIYPTLHGKGGTKSVWLLIRRIGVVVIKHLVLTEITD